MQPIYTSNYRIINSFYDDYFINLAHRGHSWRTNFWKITRECVEIKSKGRIILTPKSRSARIVSSFETTFGDFVIAWTITKIDWIRGTRTRIASLNTRVNKHDGLIVKFSESHLQLGTSLRPTPHGVYISYVATILTQLSRERREHVRSRPRSYIRIFIHRRTFPLTSTRGGGDSRQRNVATVNPRFIIGDRITRDKR